MTEPSEIPLTFVGHPYAALGVGEQMRSHLAACRAVHLPHKVQDIFRYSRRTDPDHLRLMAGVEVEHPDGGIRVFHVNGDEVERVQQAFEQRGGDFAAGYNIIVPVWELPQYPEIWAQQLRKFDEVWALSHFVADGLAAAGIQSVYVGQAVEVPLGYMLPRRYFGIRESAFVLLHFFDLTSYAARKNPDAVLAMYEIVRERREFEDMQLVLKVKRADSDGEDWLKPIREQLPEAVCLAQPMTSLETRSLINACDCFVSLHRAEGFGRGTGEAMFLGRLGMATGWSGNLDYMTAGNSLLVNHDMVAVGKDEYPFGEGQMWAEPDIGHAAAALEAVLDDRARAREIAALGRRDVRLEHSNRAVGLRIMARVAEIRENLAGKTTRRRRARRVARRDATPVQV